MTGINPAADLLDIFSQSLGQMSEATVYSVIQNALASGNGISLNRDPGSGLVTITATPIPRPVSVDGVTIFGDGTPSNPLRAVLTNNAITITPTNIPNGVISVAYSQTFVATGGTSPYTWGYSGTLPPGLTLNTSTGVLSGTPTTAGLYSFSITVTDSASRTGAVGYNLSIAAATPSSFATTYGSLTASIGNELSGWYTVNLNGAIISNYVSAVLGYPTSGQLFGTLSPTTFTDGSLLLGVFSVYHPYIIGVGYYAYVQVVIKGANGVAPPRNYFSNMTYNTLPGGTRTVLTSDSHTTYSAIGDTAVWTFTDTTRGSTNNLLPASGSGTISIV